MGVVRTSTTGAVRGGQDVLSMDSSSCAWSIVLLLCCSCWPLLQPPVPSISHRHHFSYVSSHHTSRSMFHTSRGIRWLTPKAHRYPRSGCMFDTSQVYFPVSCWTAHDESVTTACMLSGNSAGDHQHFLPVFFACCMQCCVSSQPRAQNAEVL